MFKVSCQAGWCKVCLCSSVKQEEPCHRSKSKCSTKSYRFNQGNKTMAVSACSVLCYRRLGKCPLTNPSNVWYWREAWGYCSRPLQSLAQGMALNPLSHCTVVWLDLAWMWWEHPSCRSTTRSGWKWMLPHPLAMTLSSCCTGRSTVWHRVAVCRSRPWSQEQFCPHTGFLYPLPTFCSASPASWDL